jgi:hypothetical protein
LVARRPPRGRASAESDGVLQLQHGDDGRAPTDEDVASLRRVADALPWSAFLVALVEMCERFTYYGLSGPFQNYISNRYNDPANPGALGGFRRNRSGLAIVLTCWKGLGRAAQPR